MKRVSVVVVLVVVWVAGCSPRVVGPSVTSPPDPTSGPITSWPTATPTEASTKTREQESAEKLVEDYFRMKNAMKQNHALDLDHLKKIMVGEVPEADIAQLEEDRERGLVQEGDFTFIITGSQPLETDKVEVTACTDASRMDLIDRNTGESVLDPQRHFYKGWTFEVARLDTTWKITDFNTEDIDQCHV